MYICNPFLNLPELSRVRGIVFDCDGVLFDSKEVNIRFYNQFKSLLGLPPMTKEEEKFVHVHTVQESLRHILPEEMHHRIPEIRAGISYRDLIPYMRPAEGLFECLYFLCSKGIQRAVNTNRTNTMEMVLDYFSLSGFFFPVVTAAHVSWTKPHPESLYLIMRYWRMGRDELVFIGDSEVDQKTAEDAGVSFWSFANPGLRGRMYIPDFLTLREFLGNNL
ncbi:MAG: HAD family hydrolase [Desulfonatronovibrionaceae bacterium]